MDPDSLMLASGTERYDRPDHRRRGCDHYAAGDDYLRIAAIAFIWRAPPHACITAPNNSLPRPILIIITPQCIRPEVSRFSAKALKPEYTEQH